jgi:hypothetical protein
MGSAKSLPYFFLGGTAMDNIFINGQRYKIRIEGNEWFVHQIKDPFDVVNDFGELIGWGVAAPGVDPRTAAFDAMKR